MQKYPDLGRGFSDFLAALENHDDYLQSRIWLEAGSGTVTITDQKIINRLPKNCSKADGAGGIDVIQTVIRQRRPNITVYQYDSGILGQLRKNAPLQYSFLMLHEWLWDLTSDVQVLREADRFRHSPSPGNPGR